MVLRRDKTLEGSTKNVRDFKLLVNLVSEKEEISLYSSV